MSFKKAFFKNVMISGGYNYISQIIVFLSSFITARLLLPENYGLVGLITVFTNFISVFSDSGISLAVIKSDFKLSYHKGLDQLSLWIGILLFSITVGLAWPITEFYGNSKLLLPAIVLSLTFITRSMAIVRTALISKDLKFEVIGRVTLINTVISILLTILLAYNGAEHWAIIIPQLVASIISIFYYEHYAQLGFHFYARKYVYASYRHTRTSIKNLLGFNLVNYWSRNADNLIVGKVYGMTDLGIYNRAYSLLILPLSLVTGLMGSVLYPSLKKLKAEGGDVNREYLFVLKIITIIVFPVAAIFILFPTQLVTMLWGENWKPVGDILPYFGILIFGQSLLSTTGNILVLMNLEKRLMISGWVGAFFTVLGICFGALYSIKGIAQFYSLSFILFVLPFNIYYIFHQSLGFDVRTIVVFWVPMVVLSTLLWIACYFDSSVLTYISLTGMLTNIIVNNIDEISRLSSLVSKRYFQKS
jgi:O-antigen/teichoic acid export membrane protein